MVIPEGVNLQQHIIQNRPKMESFGRPVKGQIRRDDDVRRQGDYKGDKVGKVNEQGDTCTGNL